MHVVLATSALDSSFNIKISAAMKSFLAKCKRTQELVTNLSSYKTSSEKFLNCDILPDKVWWYNIKWLLSYSKNYICYFTQPNSWHKYSTFIFPFESGKCGKKEKKITKTWIYLENDKSFLDEIESIFYSFWRATIWCKNKK